MQGSVSRTVRRDRSDCRLGRRLRHPCHSSRRPDRPRAHRPLGRDLQQRLRSSRPQRSRRRSSHRLSPLRCRRYRRAPSFHRSLSVLRRRPIYPPLKRRSCRRCLRRFGPPHHRRDLRSHECPARCRNRWWMSRRNRTHWQPARACRSPTTHALARGKPRKSFVRSSTCRSGAPHGPRRFGER
jgi:hypothetical protein